MENVSLHVDIFRWKLNLVLTVTLCDCVHVVALTGETHSISLALPLWPHTYIYIFTKYVLNWNIFEIAAKEAKFEKRKTRSRNCLCDNGFILCTSRAFHLLLCSVNTANPF